ncbi:MAG: sigma-70 family RNA polymerase sigma factor [Candidatus Omnitrophota bacterium]
MEFSLLLNRLSARLKKIARFYGTRSHFLNNDDLYQEMCLHLWNNFKDGVPPEFNDAYVIRGCEFHILNYLRKNREKVKFVSIDEPIDDNANTIKDMLVDTKEPLKQYVNRKITMEYISNNGFSKMEKDVFAFLMEGFTVREIGKKIGVSHVYVIKLKKSLVTKTKTLLL